MMDMLKDSKKQIIKKYIGCGNFGLEKESLRVRTDGFLAQTEHPFVDHPNLERDFCENQMELITDVWSSAMGAWNQLKELQSQAVNVLSHRENGEELLWPFSNPPYVRCEEEIPIARYKGEQEEKSRYREYLAEKYGKKKMLYSGIHYNYSFAEEMLQEMYAESGGDSYEHYRDHVYLNVAKKITKYSWLVVYLMAASPVTDGSFWREDSLAKDVFPQYASYRCSEIGYWNEFVPVLNYKSLDAYVSSLERYVREGDLKAAQELYYPVRLKPKGDNTLENLKRNGVSHIELRMLDLNPLSPVGICEEDMEFLHILLLYLLAQGPVSFSEEEQIQAIQNVKRASEYNDLDIRIETGRKISAPVRRLAGKILSDMECFYKNLGEEDAVQNIRMQKRKVSRPENRYAVRVQKIFGHDFVKKGLVLSKQYMQSLQKEDIVHV